MKVRWCRKANAVVGGLIPSRKIATLLDGKLRHGGKIPRVCQKNKIKNHMM